MTLIAYGLIALVIMAALGGAYHTVKESGREECRAETLAAAEQQRRDEAEKGMQAGINLETGNAKAKIVYRTITRDVDKVVDRVEYRDVCFDDDGLRLANDALRGTRAPVAGPDNALPGPGSAGDGFKSGGAAKGR